MKVCPKCGAENPDDAKFCYKCGVPLSETFSSQSNSLTHDRKEDVQEPVMSKELEERRKLWVTFVKNNAEYYVPKFVDFYALNKKISFNFSAFFFPELWLAYRKMYLYAILLMALKLFFLPIFALINRIVLLLFGNYIYFKFTESKIEAAKTKAKMLGVKPEELLSAEGGTSSAAVFVLIIAFSLVATALIVITAFLH